jgi:hypothetical protein
MLARGAMRYARAGRRDGRCGAAVRPRALQMRANDERASARPPLPQDNRVLFVYRNCNCLLIRTVL